MPFTSPLNQLLPTSDSTIILDGALATHLETLGADLTDPLWSCRALLTSPDLIRQTHISYFLAGADVAITASYQATTEGLAAHQHLDVSEAKRVIGSSVCLARDAVSKVQALEAEKGKPRRLMLIAGSVGPYGAFLADGSEYRGDYSADLTKKALKDFHRPRMEALVEAGADLLALETMPNLLEIEALIELLAEEFAQTAAWLSLSLKAGDARYIADGTVLDEVAAVIENSTQIVAIGVNCVPRELVTLALSILSKASSKLLLCYPNSGEVYDSQTKTWSGQGQGDSMNGWSELIKDWRQAGAKLIGGCCRTGPKDIELIKHASMLP